MIPSHSLPTRPYPPSLSTPSVLLPRFSVQDAPVATLPEKPLPPDAFRATERNLSLSESSDKVTSSASKRLPPMPPPPVFTPIELPPLPPFHSLQNEASLPIAPQAPVLSSLDWMPPDFWADVPDSTLPSSPPPPMNTNLTQTPTTSVVPPQEMPSPVMPPAPAPFISQTANPNTAPLPMMNNTPSTSTPFPPSTTPLPQATPESALPLAPTSRDADLPPDVRGFDDNIIRSLNARLEDPDWMRRADAANDYFIILSANPNLEKRPEYKPYVDAFALKILRDPSSVVHEAMLRAMQVGYYRYPSPEVLNELYRLRDSAGMLGLESQIVDDAIHGIQKAQLEDAKEAQHQQQQAPLSSRKQI